MVTRKIIYLLLDLFLDFLDSLAFFFEYPPITLTFAHGLSGSDDSDDSDDIPSNLTFLLSLFFFF